MSRADVRGDAPSQSGNPQGSHLDGGGAGAGGRLAPGGGAGAGALL